MPAAVLLELALVPLADSLETQLYFSLLTSSITPSARGH
jgi:hypothetical protein